MSGREGPHRPAGTGVEKLGTPLRTLVLSFTVDGPPVQQGSKSPKLIWKGKTPIPTLFDQNAPALRPWRQNVRGAAMGAMLRQHVGTVDEQCAVRLVFTMPTVKTAPRRIFPAVKPDVDKLARACLDSLTDAMAWTDDSLCCELTAVKTYPGMHPEALDQAGVRVSIFTLTAPTPRQETLL